MSSLASLPDIFASPPSPALRPEPRSVEQQAAVDTALSDALTATRITAGEPLDSALRPTLECPMPRLRPADFEQGISVQPRKPESAATAIDDAPAAATAPAVAPAASADAAAHAGAAGDDTKTVDDDGDSGGNWDDDDYEPPALPVSAQAAAASAAASAATKAKAAAPQGRRRGGSTRRGGGGGGGCGGGGAAACVVEDAEAEWLTRSSAAPASTPQPPPAQRLPLPAGVGLFAKTRPQGGPPGAPGGGGGAPMIPPSRRSNHPADDEWLGSRRSLALAAHGSEVVGAGTKGHLLKGTSVQAITSLNTPASRKKPRCQECTRPLEEGATGHLCGRCKTSAR
jgi:hypothetical protein